MHSGREIARRLRLYLEAWFRAKYMSRAESAAVYNLGLQKPGKGGAVSAASAPVTAANTKGVGGRGRGLATIVSEVPVINLTGLGNKKAESCNAAATAAAVDVAISAASVTHVAENIISAVDVKVDETKKPDVPEMMQQQQELLQHQEAVAVSSSSSSSSKSTQRESLPQQHTEDVTEAAVPATTAVESAPTLRKSKTKFPSSSSSSVEELMATSSASVTLPPPPPPATSGEGGGLHMQNSTLLVRPLEKSLQAVVSTSATTTTTTTEESTSTRGNDPLSMDFFLASLASAPGHRRRGRTSSSMMMMAPPAVVPPAAVIPVADSLILPLPPPLPKMTFSKPLPSTEQPSLPPQRDGDGDESDNLVDNDNEQKKRGGDITRGNDPLSYDFILSALASAPGHSRRKGRISGSGSNSSIDVPSPVITSSSTTTDQLFVVEALPILPAITNVPLPVTASAVATTTVATSSLSGGVGGGQSIIVSNSSGTGGAGGGNHRGRCHCHGRCRCRYGHGQGYSLGSGPVDQRAVEVVFRRSKLVSGAASDGESTTVGGNSNGGGGGGGGGGTIHNVSGGDSGNDEEALISSSRQSSNNSVSSWPWLSNVQSLFGAEKFVAKTPMELPRQDNDYDCGLFALQYAESFCIPLLPHITSAHLSTQTKMKAIFGDFFPESNIERKRNEIRRLILNVIAKRAECKPR
jgi:hypothetical protein